MATASLLNQILVNLIRTATLVIVLLDVMAIMVFVWGIVKFIFAASNPEKLKDAKKILWWGVIGLFVLASVTGIVIALQSYFGVTNQRIPVPQFGPGGGSTTIGNGGNGVGGTDLCANTPPGCTCDPSSGYYICK